MLVSVVLVAIPWLAYRYFDEVAVFVLEGQRSALQLAAQAVSTVLHDREDLFGVDATLPIPLADCSPLPLAAPVQLDGNSRDWSDLSERTCHFDAVDRVGAAGKSQTGNAGSLDLALGERGGHLYALFRVRDDVVRFRSPRRRNLDSSDHLRLVLPDADGGQRRVLVTAEQDGPVSAYAVDERWKYALADGKPLRSVRGHWGEAPGGYTIELRLPLDLLPTKKIGFAVADVDALAGPIVGQVGTVPSAATGTAGAIDLVVLPSPGIHYILRALDLPGARISVFDRELRVRAVAGEEIEAVEGVERERLIRGSLEHRVGSDYRVEPFSGERVTAASAPVQLGESVMGAVLIEQSNREILGFQRAQLERALFAIIAACIAIAGILWGFALRLVWRIHRLRDEASAAIDDDGRVLEIAVVAGRRAGDEVGDLSRTISGLLGRLAGYTEFLQRIPRTLRHELSNPLNSLSTSLQNLVSDHPELEDSKYVQSAERGVARIGEIVEGLTDAASLEQALRDDEPERVDFAHLVVRYVENFATSCPGRSFLLCAAAGPVFVEGSGFRMEQMLDKLIDNAVAFSPRESEIEVELHVAGNRARLSVGNAGSGIPESIRERVFDSMVSAPAASTSGRPHLGIGLYVVRLIVEHMDGAVEVHDRDGGGAIFVVDLPVASN
jgi:two-component system sensor histidine kinase ChvG